MLKLTLLFILIIVTAVADFQCGLRQKIDVKSRAKRIVDGEYTTLGEYPWSVVVIYVKSISEQYIRCGGSLIAKSWALSIIRCFTFDNSTHMVTNYKIRLGEYNTFHWNEPLDPITITKIKIFPHPLFDNGEKFDMALLKFDPIEFQPHIQPICLPTFKESKNLAGKMATFVGLGSTSHNDPDSPIPLQVKFPIWESSQCDRYVRSYHDTFYNFTSDIFCAGYRHGKRSTCSFDFGNGLQLQRDNDQWYLVGLMVLMDPKCSGPATFNSVAHFMPWIRRTMNNQ